MNDISVYTYGSIYGEDKGTGYAGNVWDKTKLCPSITTSQGGNRQPMIIEDFYENRNPRTYDNYSPTIRSKRIGLKTIESRSDMEDNEVKRVGQISSDGSQYGSVVSENGLNPTLQAGTHGYANNCIQSRYRIRKLTPKECWRLMGFKDNEFDAAEKTNSNTNLYKQAGNSIVVPCLTAIFSQLNIQNIPKWNDLSDEEKRKLI